MGQHADSESEICSSSTVKAEQCMNWVSFARQRIGEMQALQTGADAPSRGRALASAGVAGNHRGSPVQ